MPIPKRLAGQNSTISLLDDAPRRGGQAEVYHGRDSAGRSVAVKIANEGAEERRGLIAERDALTAIQRRQPGSDQWLVPVLDEGTLPDGRPFIVLPWFEHSMQSWLRSRQPGLLRRLEALTLTGEAVVRLHRSAASLTGVVLHRDLKPSNLLVEDGGDGLRVVLADLGGVKERHLHGETQNTGIHTPYFAPLEQTLPLARPPDPSVDVHALAVLIYVVLAGRAPQAVMVRQALLTDASEELLKLHLARGRRSASEEARYDELRRSPIGAMIDLEGAQPLPEEDVRRLRDSMLGLLADRDEAETLADELTRALVPTLRHAMELDPSRRLSRPEGLLAALEAMVERLGGRRVVVAVEEAPTTTAPAAPPVAQLVAVPPAPQNAQGRPPRRWGALLLVGLAALGLCAGGLSMSRIVGDHEPSVGLVSVRPEDAPGVPEPGASQKTPPAPAPPAPAEPDATAQQARPADPSPGTGKETKAPVVPGQTLHGEDAGSGTVERAPDSEPLLPLPVVVISAKGDGDALVYVDGTSHTHGFRGELKAGEHPVEIRSEALQRNRLFSLSVTQEGDKWSVAVMDPLAKADPAKRVPGSAIVRLRWASDGSLRFEE